MSLGFSLCALMVNGKGVFLQLVFITYMHSYASAVLGCHYVFITTPVCNYDWTAVLLYCF